MVIDTALFVALLGAGPTTVPPPIATQAERVVVWVASHRGCPGQANLRFAGYDADRMQAVLTELGGFSKGDVIRLIDPTPDALDSSVADAARRIGVYRERGADTVLASKPCPRPSEWLF